jgi:hypothetical protein
MLRGLLLAVLAANLIFLAWSQGWLAPTAPGPRTALGEPQRVANQVRPDWVQVVPPGLSQPRQAGGQVSDAVSDPASGSASGSANEVSAASDLPATNDEAWVCLEAGPFTTAEAGAAEASLAAAGISGEDWSRETLTATSSPDATVNQVWLRVARASAELQTQLQTLPAATLAGRFWPCRSR